MTQSDNLRVIANGGGSEQERFTQPDLPEELTCGICGVVISKGELCPDCQKHGRG